MTITGETMFCGDCPAGTIANTRCVVEGHGFTSLDDLLDSYSNGGDTLPAQPPREWIEAMGERMDDSLTQLGVVDDPASEYDDGGHSIVTTHDSTRVILARCAYDGLRKTALRTSSPGGASTPDSDDAS